MIKFEYIPWKPTFADASEPSPVQELTMTLGDNISWDEAVCEFQNFLRAAGYVIPYDFEEEDECNTDVAEVERLRAKKKQIYEDLKDDINEWFEYTPQEKNT